MNAAYVVVVFFALVVLVGGAGSGRRRPARGVRFGCARSSARSTSAPCWPRATSQGQRSSKERQQARRGLEHSSAVGHGARAFPGRVDLRPVAVRRRAGAGDRRRGPPDPGRHAAARLSGGGVRAARGRHLRELPGARDRLPRSAGHCGQERAAPGGHGGAAAGTDPLSVPFRRARRHSAPFPREPAHELRCPDRNTPLGTATTPDGSIDTSEDRRPPSSHRKTPCVCARAGTRSRAPSWTSRSRRSSRRTRWCPRGSDSSRGRSPTSSARWRASGRGRRRLDRGSAGGPAALPVLLQPPAGLRRTSGRRERPR